MKLHLYSDFNLGYLQFTDPVDEVVPAETDLIVVAGNISRDMKRSLLFQETLNTNKKPVIINLGLVEYMANSYYTLMDAVKIRYATKKDLNCYFGGHDNIIVENVDVLGIGGWRFAADEEDFKASNLCNVSFRVHKKTYQYDENGELIGFVDMTMISFEEYNQFVQEQMDRLKHWAATDNGYPKLLVVGADARKVLADCDLTGITVCSAGPEYLDQEFNGGRIIANPGAGALARSRLFEI